MTRFTSILLAGLALSLLAGAECSDPPHDSDFTQRQAQERILAEGTSQVGMPAIVNFRERKLLKDILELRDNAKLVTYTYLVGEESAQPRFFCNSLGYGLPYATQFTSPQKPMWDRGDHNGGNITLPQADPNGLFSPASAEGTWVLCKDPVSARIGVVYVEPRIIVSPFPLPGIERPSAEKP